MSILSGERIVDVTLLLDVRRILTNLWCLHDNMDVFLTIFQLILIAQAKIF
jgi:hypothetical protein